MKKRMLLIGIGLMLALGGCGNPESKLLGEYSGTSDSYIKLMKDGECVYSESDYTGSAKGTWFVEDGVVYVYADNLGYTIYAEIDEDDDGLLFKSESYSWNDEYFTKK